MFSYKLFKLGEDTMLAISDISVIGKKFVEKGMQLEVPESFYSGETCDESNAIQLIREATIINAVGNEIISLMLENKIIEEDKVLKIGGVPHAQIVSVK